MEVSTPKASQRARTVGLAMLGLIAQETDAAKAMGIRATPTFLVNGQVIQGALPFVQF